LKPKYDELLSNFAFNFLLRRYTKVAKRFINDTIRSDFHKRFLSKYIK